MQRAVRQVAVAWARHEERVRGVRSHTIGARALQAVAASLGAVFSRPNGEQRERTRRHARLSRVGSARQHDRNARSEDDAGELGPPEVLKLLHENIAGLEVGNDEYV